MKPTFARQATSKWYLFFFFFVLAGFLPSYIHAQTSNTTIDATLKISVCGNNEIEGGEDCEGSNLNNQTCESLDFQSGNLSCDVSCSYITSQCVPKPTPTPSPTPTATTQPTSTVVASPEPTPSPQPAVPLFLTQLPDLPTITLRNPFITLPSRLATLDPNGDNVIDQSEIVVVLTDWTTVWKTEPTSEKCDVNNDGRCDLLDFSIVLAYVEETP